ncbi:death-associated protein-like 1 isoform X2 [Lagopus leucura]|uniref:death-associated protein-like 1 isoform X2 n=1 Tax=Lagopus leucura TaxID=30410 RepID=UPI001C662FC6|nr:death-associated protein-like 1 isoform X2 [Lagopus leucura]
MARRTVREPLAVPGGRAPSVRAGGVRVSKKQEAIPAGRNAGPKGRDKTSVVSISKIHHMDVMLRKGYFRTNPFHHELGSAGKLDPSFHIPV